MVFRQVGTPEFTIEYVLRVLTNPLFIVVVMSAFGGAVLRMFVFREFGVTRTVIMSEATVVLSLILAFVIFREDINFTKFLIGSAMILIGVFIVQS
ncbi:MAG: hypothetical protein WDZ94_03115 [Patescibacteria group bacterium]